VGSDPETRNPLEFVQIGKLRFAIELLKAGCCLRTASVRPKISIGAVPRQDDPSRVAGRSVVTAAHPVPVGARMTFPNVVYTFGGDRAQRSDHIALMRRVPHYSNFATIKVQP